MTPEEHARALLDKHCLMDEIDLGGKYRTELFVHKDRALAAITEALAYLLKQEPVGWIYEDTLPENYPYDVMFTHSQVRGGVRMFPVYLPAASQPQEPTT